MKKKVILALLSLCTVFIVGMRIVMNPEALPDSLIRKQMLSQFPVGTPMDKVIQFANKKKEWSNVEIDHGYGYSKDSMFGEEIGKKHVSVVIGRHRIMFVTVVIVNFGFDENSELVNIRVYKEVNGI